MDSQPLGPVAFVAPAAFASATETGPRQFSGTAYGGGIVTDHPLFERVAFDLSTTLLKTPAAALFDHKRAVGVIKRATLDNKIDIGGDLFSDVNGPAKDIADMADRGMPWQLSVRIYPGKIDQIKAGAKVKLNGQEFAGPLTVFRNNRVREVSFVELGADDNTNASIFSLSEGGTRADPNPTGAPMTDTTVTIDKAEHDRVVADFQSRLDAATEASKAASERVTALEGEFAATKKAARTDDVKALFSAIGREFKDADAAPYVEMNDATFSIVAADLRASRPKLDPALTQTQATNFAASPLDGDSKLSPTEIVAAAEAYIAAQKAAGREISNTEAVAFVSKPAV